MTADRRHEPWEVEPLVIGPVWGRPLPDDTDRTSITSFDFPLIEPFPWTRSKRPQDTAPIAAVDSPEAWGPRTLSEAMLERPCRCGSRGRGC